MRNELACSPRVQKALGVQVFNKSRSYDRGLDELRSDDHVPFVPYAPRGRLCRPAGRAGEGASLYRKWIDSSQPVKQQPLGWTSHRGFGELLVTPQSKRHDDVHDASLTAASGDGPSTQPDPRVQLQQIGGWGIEDTPLNSGRTAQAELRH